MNMRNKLVSVSFAAVGLTAAATASAADFTSLTQLTRGERGAWCLIESFMSTAAAAMQAQAGAGCRFTAGSLLIDVDPDGNGTGSLGTITLENTQTNNTLGTKCKVTQVGSGQLDFIKLNTYTTIPNHAFSRFGDVFIDAATVNVAQNSGVFAPFDEHSIKNFNLGVSSYSRCPSNPAVIFDDGKEVITKNGFPLTKWIQFSAYARDFVFYDFPLGLGNHDDFFFTVKLRGVQGGFPGRGTDCAIVASGEFVELGGLGVNIVGTLQTLDPTGTLTP